MTEHYAVFGNPVRHSLSPRIHSVFAAQTGADMQYSAREVAPDGFAAAADAFFEEENGQGLNITLPFKGEAFRYASSVTDRACRAEAVNVLRRNPEGGTAGDNTDGAGLLRDLCVNLGWEISGRRVLLLGAGGAVRGVLEPLLQARPAQLLIVNRTPERAQQLAVRFADGCLRACGYRELAREEPFELIINGSSAGFHGEAPPLPERIPGEGARAYDMSYGRPAQPFMRLCAARGVAQCSDGLGMLVEQAAESFLIWRGVRPQTEELITRLRKEVVG